MTARHWIILTELSLDLLDIREVQAGAGAELVVGGEREGGALLGRSLTVGERHPAGPPVPGHRLGVGDPVQEVGDPQHGLLGHSHQLVLQVKN